MKCCLWICGTVRCSFFSHFYWLKLKRRSTPCCLTWTFNATSPSASALLRSWRSWWKPDFSWQPSPYRDSGHHTGESTERRGALPQPSHPLTPFIFSLLTPHPLTPSFCHPHPHTSHPIRLLTPQPSSPQLTIPSSLTLSPLNSSHSLPLNTSPPSLLYLFTPHHCYPLTLKAPVPCHLVALGSCSFSFV